MKYDIIVIGGGASGLMAAYSAAARAAERGEAVSVCILEKMPRPARKVMITGKGRCNFTNLKDWGTFSAHIRAGAQFVRPAWRNFPPQVVIEWFEGFGMPSVVERGDRAYPASYRASDVVDTLVRACLGAGVIIQTGAEVAGIEHSGNNATEADGVVDYKRLGPYESPLGINSSAAPFRVILADGTTHTCSRLIIATGGLSYPGTGSTGDGLQWARTLGHTVTPLFPSLTA